MCVSVCVCVCVCVCEICCKLGKNFAETVQLLNQAYGEDCMSRKQCYEWFKRFKEGRMSIGEDLSLERLVTLTNDDHVGRVRAVIRVNHHLTFQDVVDEVGISVGYCHQIFTEKLQMPRVSVLLCFHLFCGSLPRVTYFSTLWIEAARSFECTRLLAVTPQKTVFKLVKYILKPKNAL